MQVPEAHPALQIASELYGEQGWSIVDALARGEQAVAVELRRSGRRLAFVCVAREGEWSTPGIVPSDGQAVPSQRRATTLTHEPFEHFHTTASAWPAEDGQGEPDEVWMSVSGFAAEDVSAVRVATSLDDHEAPTKTDGSFLTLVKAAFREQPEMSVQAADGSWQQVAP